MGRRLEWPEFTEENFRAIDADDSVGIHLDLSRLTKVTAFRAPCVFDFFEVLPFVAGNTRESIRG